MNKRVICVLGMHRSGTSATTRALNIMGVSLGEKETLMNPGFDNPKGYWENKKIVDIHDEILQLHSRTWDSTKPLPKEWWKKSEVSPLRDELEEITHKNLLSNDLWMWKDPRTSLLIPLWKQILKKLDISPLFIICIRNPLDVHLSLKKRNQFSQEKSFKLWNLYTISSLFWTHNENRIIIHYDLLLNETINTLKKISPLLDIPSFDNNQQIVNELEEFIDQNLRHSYSSKDQLLNTPNLLLETKILYLKLLKEIKNPSADFNETIDNLYLSLFSS